jgi:hypothetical protein
MKIPHVLSLLLIAVAAIACRASAVTAQSMDQCRDILRDGTFQQSRFRENTFFQQIIYSRFLSSSYEQSRSDKSLGFGVPVGELVLGGNYTEDQFNQKKQQIQRIFSSNTISARELDIALASGDEVVIGAWAGCMRNKGGGLGLRFEAVSPTEVFATLEWFPAAGITQTRLDERITFPQGAVVTQGAGCFQKGRWIRASQPCQATIRLPDARTTLFVSVNTQHGSTRAYLPPRITLRREMKPHVFLKADSLETHAFRTSLYPRREITLSQQQMEDGWSFDPSTFRVALDASGSCNMNGAGSLHQSANLYTISYGFHVWGHTRGNSRNCSGVGRVHPSVMLVRDRWIPMTAPGELDDAAALMPTSKARIEQVWIP